MRLSCFPSSLTNPAETVVPVMTRALSSVGPTRRPRSSPRPRKGPISKALLMSWIQRTRLTWSLGSTSAQNRFHWHQFTRLGPNFTYLKLGCGHLWAITRKTFGSFLDIFFGLFSNLEMESKKIESVAPLPRLVFSCGNCMANSEWRANWHVTLQIPHPAFAFPLIAL